MAQIEPLQCVGAMLDASARVYAFRVDNTHCECFTVRTNIDEGFFCFNNIFLNLIFYNIYFYHNFTFKKIYLLKIFLDKKKVNDMDSIGKLAESLDNDNEECDTQDAIENNTLNDEECSDNVLDEQRVKKKKRGFKVCFLMSIDLKIN